MFYPAPRPDSALGYMLEDEMWPDDKATYISDELVFKIIIICQMLCYHLQKQGLLPYPDLRSNPRVSVPLMKFFFWPQGTGR